MPSTYAHRRFGADVLVQLPRELREKITPYRPLYDMGLHGPDLMFYYRALQSNPGDTPSYYIFAKSANLYCLSLPDKTNILYRHSFNKIFKPQSFPTYIKTENKIFQVVHDLNNPVLPVNIL